MPPFNFNSIRDQLTEMLDTRPDLVSEVRYHIIHSFYRATCPTSSYVFSGGYAPKMAMRAEKPLPDGFSISLPKYKGGKSYKYYLKFKHGRKIEIIENLDTFEQSTEIKYH